MTKSEQEPTLDENKKREVLAILFAGCGRATAARYVGCPPGAIYRAAQSDPQFAEQLRHAESRLEIEYMSNIQKAAAQTRYWRAAAWALERKYPSNYGPRPADSLTRDQVEQMFQQVATLIAECLPVSQHRHTLLKRLDALVQKLRGPKPRMIKTCETKPPAEH